MSGIQMALFFASGSDVFNTIPTGPYIDNVLTPTDAFTSWNVNSNGTIVIDYGSGLDESYDWITPTTSGGSYYVRVTATSGTFSTSSGTGTWLATSSNRFWRVDYTSNTAGSKSTTFTVDFATDSGGTNIVKTQTGIVITATVE